MIALRSSLDFKMVQQLLRMPGVFAGDQVDLAQNSECAKSDVLEISDWRRDNIKTRSERRSVGRACIVASRSQDDRSVTVQTCCREPARSSLLCTKCCCRVYACGARCWNSTS